MVAVNAHFLLPPRYVDESRELVVQTSDPRQILHESMLLILAVFVIGLSPVVHEV